MLSALHMLVVGLVRRTWLVAVVAIVACGVFAARAVSALAAVERGPAAIAPVIVAPPAPPPARDSGALVERNMFCSDCAPPSDGESGPVDHVSTYRGEPAMLIATSLGATPIATVRVLATEVAGSWGLGERIPGVGTVATIGYAWIDVADDAGNHTRLTLLEPVVPAAAARPGAATPGATAAADPYAGRITKRDDGSYEVERSLVRELVSGAAKPGAVRLLPMTKNGEVTGVRVLGAKPGSIATAVGLKSNDQITEIDGKPLKNAQQLLDLLATLDDTRQVTVGGTRGKTPLALTLHLR